MTKEIKVSNGKEIKKVSPEVAKVLVDRYNFKIMNQSAEEMKKELEMLKSMEIDEIKETLDSLGVEYHTNLGLEKLKEALKNARK